MTSWSSIFLRAARRLVDRTTYLVLAIGVLVGGAPLFLLRLLVRDDADTNAVVAVWIISTIWIWVVTAFVWGALAVAAAERPGIAGPNAVLGRTITLFGSFLAATLILAGVGILVLLAIAVLSLPGMGAPTTAPIQAALTPILLVAGGITLFLLIAMLRLSFAAVAVEGAPAGRAVSRAWGLLRKRTAEVVLFLVVDMAMLLGVVFGVLVPVLVGAGWAVGIEAAFFVTGDVSDFANDFLTWNFTDADLAFGVAGALLFTAILLIFGAMAAGAASSFTWGSVVGFYVMVTQDQPRAGTGRAAAGAASFCDGCSAPVPANARFCDVCGTDLVLT